MMIFEKSRLIQKRIHEVIPGGCHTYAKGDDQFPEHMPIYIKKGKGCHVWDVDGNEYIEYNMGLRAVTLGHAFKPVLKAAYKGTKMGNNFVRPSYLELECAEKLKSLIPYAEMVKFGKNGSDTTDAAIRLARAFTGRDYVAVCADHPFFSISDWFMVTTPVAGGIPEIHKNLALKFKYNDIDSIKKLFESQPNKVACLIMEAEKNEKPTNNFLKEVREICHKNGALFILDEMITGFRWDIGGAQKYYQVEPDLACFGKALGNGFSISALTGKKEIMELGGLSHDKKRVFLLSLTHGAESTSLAAALEVMKIYQTESVVETLWDTGRYLTEKLKPIIAEFKLEEHIQLLGKPCCLVYTTKDNDLQPSQPFRTLFLQEAIRRGLLATSFVTSYSHTHRELDRTVEIINEVLTIYRKALDEGIDKYLKGRSIKTVYRTYN